MKNVILNIEKEYECVVVVCGRGVRGFAAVAVRDGVTAKKIPPHPLKKEKDLVKNPPQVIGKHLRRICFSSFSFRSEKT